MSIMARAGHDGESNNMLLWLSKQLTSEWREVGLVLGLDVSQLHHIEEDHRSNSQERNFQMLMEWKQKNGKNATREVLLEALRRAGRADLADAVYNENSETAECRMEIYQAGALDAALEELNEEFDPMIVVDKLIKLGVLTYSFKDQLQNAKRRRERIKLFLSTLKAVNGRAFPILVDLLQSHKTCSYSQLGNKLKEEGEQLKIDFKKELRELLSASCHESISVVKLLIKIKKELSREHIVELQKGLHCHNGLRKTDTCVMEFLKSILKEGQTKLLLEAVQKLGPTYFSSAIEDFHRVRLLPALPIAVSNGGESSKRRQDLSENVRPDVIIETLIEIYLFFRESYGVHFDEDKMSQHLRIPSQMSLNQLWVAYGNNTLQRELTDVMKHVDFDSHVVVDVKNQDYHRAKRQFEERGTHTDGDMLEQASKVCLNEFRRDLKENNGVYLDEVKKGSIVFKLTIPTIDALDSLIQDIRSGALKMRMLIIIQRRMGDKFKGVEVDDLKLTYDKKEITTARDLLNRTGQDKSTNEIEISETDSASGGVQYSTSPIADSSADVLEGTEPHSMLYEGHSNRSDDQSSMSPTVRTTSTEQANDASTDTGAVDANDKQGTFNTNMDGLEVQTLDTNMIVLKEELEPLIVMNYLMENDVMDSRDIELLERTKSRSERVDSFISTLKTKGNAAFWSFLDALRQSGCYIHVVNELELPFKTSESTVTTDGATLLLKLSMTEDETIPNSHGENSNESRSQNREEEDGTLQAGRTTRLGGIAHQMQINPVYADRRREAQLILTVAEMNLLKYREGELSRIKLMQQQKVVHHLNTPQQKINKPASETAQNVLRLIQSMKGNFVYCCSQCYHASPPRISVQHHKETSKCTNNERRHDWTTMNRLLVFFDYTGGPCKIRPRPPRMRPKVVLCWHRMRRHSCARGDACVFAHSEVEVDFWLFEHTFPYISRDEVVEISEEVHRPKELATMPAPAPKQPTPSLSLSAPASSLPAPAPISSAPTLIPSAPKAIPPFQHKLRILCGICYPGVITERSERNHKTCGSSSPHPWGVQVVYEIYTGLKRWVRVLPRHPKLRLEIHPSICWRRMKCDHRGIMNQQCLFPHYQEEKDLWIYQARNKLLKIEDVVEVQRGGIASSSGQSQSQARGTARMPTEGTGTTSQFVCTYCKQVFDEKWHLEQHLKSPGHAAKMNTDQEKKWQHRDAPAHVTNGIYRMCRYNTEGMCRYSWKPDDENLCDSAHSEEELREWEERHKYRMMKMDKAREWRLFSFLDELIQAYNFTNKKEEVMMKELPGVEVSCVQQLEVTIPYEGRSEEGSYSKQWEFQVTVSSDQKKLKRIGLLYDEHRHYFYLSHPSGGERPQICPGSRLVIDTNDRNRYSFQVLFTSNVLGRFHQWVVFDFGSKPVMYIPLLINIGSEQSDLHLVESSTDIKESWNDNNSVIIKYPAEEPEDPIYQFLRVQYPPPLAGQVKLNEDHQMTYRNVKDHFHKMLILEELACNERLKKFSGWTRLELCDAITEGIYQKASVGELFGKISLSESLLDDSEASQIVVSNVCFALLKFHETANIVYQAKILTEVYMDLRTQDSIYISLSEQCIREQGLDANTKNLKILVQFQLERIPFCEMHYGVDNVTEMNLLYPPANMIPRFPKVTRYECDRLGMNPRQAAASTYIEQAHKSLPFVPGPTMIIGPFGTGKTWTMAKSMIGLLRQSPNNKILVCTHSSSAADWLVTYYLHPFLLQRQRMDATSKQKLLRVYATVKSPASVDQVILDNYAIFKEGTNKRSFRKPTFRDILDCNIVVVTLATSIHLVALNEGGCTIKGFFKLIFIDEAAQALETEVIIPLGLAVRETLVVMAGDHIQMRPKVYSVVARKHRFHMSMLERLFHWEKKNRCNNVCFLTYNYRMVDEILRFIARYHYQCKLVTRSNHYRHPDYHPMSFLTVKGTDQLIGTSYVNTAEVNAIVEQVQELVRRWPSRQWGEEYSIAVLTPYRLQVELIRKKLRKQGLEDVNVESVQNVPGKEFKAVFISTVRTRNTLNKAQITAISNPGQGSYNEQFYYGFLSDERELITAFTRCQCLLYVVGDPIALCSVGDCHSTWEKYIKECENNFSLYPPGITLESIKQEIQAARQMLNPLANTFQPQPIPSVMSPPFPAEGGVPASESAFPKAPAPVSAWNMTRGNLGERVPSSSVLMERLSSVDFPSLHQATQEALEDEFGDYQEELDIDDEILKELRIQVTKDEKVYKEVKEREFARLPSKDATIWDALEEASEDEEPVKGGGEDDDDNDSFILEISDDEAGSGHSSALTPPSEEKTSLDEDNEYLNKEGDTQQTMPRANFRMIERDGDIFLVRHNRDTSELKSAKDYDAYNSDEEKDFLETELNEDKTDDWLRRTLEEPDDYKVCIIRFEPSGRVYAILADGSSVEEIVISSKRRRERALDGDKVVMHILSETDGDYEIDRDSDAPRKIYGEVKHILERFIHPEFKKIVCTIDPVNHDLMCPVDRSFPKMFPMFPGRTKEERLRSKGQPEFLIYNIFNGKFERARVVKVKYADIPNKLFVVQYYEWFPDTAYPVGIVTEELPPCDSPKNALRILKLMHGVKDQWPPQFAKEIEDQFPRHWEIPEEELIAREEGDFRSKAVFTVDPPDAQDLDDALHVERLKDGMMRVGVHIADVSYFIAKDCPLDGEARKRGTTFYPAFYASASHMLPSQFSTSLCSLLPDTEKLTLSVIFMFDRDGKQIGNPQILRSIICPVERLSYETVERFLLNQTDGCHISEQVQRQILDLHHLTSYLRTQRLGDGRFFYQPDETNADVTCAMAHTLVEEMMICANEAVAKFLVNRYGMNVPVRHQPPPDRTKTQEWLTNYGKDSGTSFRLSSIMPKIKQVIKENHDVRPDEGDGRKDEDDRNSLAGSDVSDFSTEGEEEVVEGVPVTQVTWNKIMGVLDNINHTQLDFQNIIGNEGGHPKQAVALSQLYRIMAFGRYYCANVLVNGCGHFDLQKDFYTHFTSPIRRYIDLVVHRMVTAGISREDAPYTPRELADICHHCNDQSSKAKKYGAMSHCLLSALKLKLAAEPKLSFVEAADDKGLQVMYPHKRYLRATQSSTSIPLKLLKPAKKPEDGEGPNSVRLHFKNSVYDLVSKIPELPGLPAFLETDRFVQTLPLSSWNKIQNCLREEDSEGLEDLLYKLRMQVENGSLAINTQSSRIAEVTCEVQSRNQAGKDMALKKYAEFKCDFNPGQVMQVQLASGIQKGLLVPKLQLVSLTPKFSFCVEHRGSPVECFARLADKPPERCRTIIQYVESWLPVVDMMVVYKTVSRDETTFIRDIQIQWYKSQEADSTIGIRGCFSLDKDWCNDRQVRFSSTVNRQKGKKSRADKDIYEDQGSEFEEILFRDYLCIRIDGYHVAPNVQFKMKSLEQKPGLVSSNLTNPHCGTMTLVVHGLTTSVSDERRGGNESVTVEFKVHQNACDIPQELFDQDKGTTCCMVELIPKSQSDRRMEDAVYKLQDPKSVRNLIRHICLQRSAQVMNNVEDSDVVSKYLLRAGAQFILTPPPRNTFHPPNESQAAAIRIALSNTFAVIQGPPGTGKTCTGAFLAYYFHLINRGLQETQKVQLPQILYCGPSDKSVDVIAGYLKEFMSDDFSIVRVYSEMIQQQEFPIPGMGSAERKFGSGGQEARMDPSLKNLSLHHRIRAPHAPYSDKIRDYERKFADRNLQMTKRTRKDIKDYKNLLKAAEKSELPKHQVVLATCNASGRVNLKESVNIVQLIIDEAGMCSELESLIPMVNHNPSQVVLIGDHMQLSPIIQEPHAMEFGAGKSLMEKYETRTHTLNIQYRMHEEICYFPSNAFYQGQLQTAPAVLNRKPDVLTGHIWPNGPEYPRVFCHVVGVEDTLTVLSEEGNEMSKSNPQEVGHVARIVDYFINQLGVQPHQLVVLSQYQLQCAQISEQLGKTGLKDIAVATVIKSQGSEWDYVIFSTVRSMAKIEIEDRPGKGWKMRHLGFTMDENQMNVAMSRARRGHIVVGNKFLLGTLPKWSDLLQAYENTNSLLPAKGFPRNVYPRRR